MALDTAAHLDSFFVTGGTLAPGVQSYILREADRQLLDALRRGELCYVLNSRQMGKSSLCIRTRIALENEGTRTVFLDLSKYGAVGVTLEQWYFSLLSEIGRSLKCRDLMESYWRKNFEHTPLDRFFGALQEVALVSVSSPLVVFIDEVDKVCALKSSGDDFFGAIRQSYNERASEPALRRLTFCLVGSATPADLVYDSRLSPFNVGQQIDLKDFTAEELTPLARGLVGHGRDGEALLARIHHWTGGHPYLTQAVCAHVARDASLRTSEDVDRLIASLYLEESARRDVVHLADVANRMLRRGYSESVDLRQEILHTARLPLEADLVEREHRAQILTLYETILRETRIVMDDPRDVRINLLKLSGVVRVERGKIRVRNRIYQEVFDADWIDESYIDAQERKIRAAEYRARLQTRIQICSITFAVFLTLAAIALSARGRSERELERSREALEYAQNRQQILTATNARVKREAAKARRAEAEARRSTNTARNAAALAQQREKEATAQKQIALEERSRAERERRSALLANEAERRSREVARVHSEYARRIDYNHSIGLADQALRAIGERDYNGVEPNAADYDATRADAHLAARVHLDRAQQFTAGKQPINSGFEWTYLDELTRKDRATFRGHQGPIESVAFAADGKRLLSAAHDGTVRIWDVATNQMMGTLKASTERITSACFSPGDRQVAIASADSTVKLWDLSTGRVRVFPGHQDFVRSICFSPDGRRLASASWDKTVRLWDVATGKSFPLIGHKNTVTSVSFSPDGQRLVSASWDNTARLWDVATGQQIRLFGDPDPDKKKGHSKGIWGVSYSPDGRYIATASEDTNARLWDVESGESIIVNQWPTAGLAAVRFSPDGRRLATAAWNGTARLWELIPSRGRLPNVRYLRTFVGHTKEVTDVAFSPDGRYVATASKDKTIKLWDWRDRTYAVTIPKIESVRILSWATLSPDGTLLATTRWDTDKRGSVEVWEVRTLRQVASFSGHKNGVLCASFSPDNRKLVTSSWDGTARVWDLRGKDATLVLRHEKGRYGNGVVAVSYSPDGSRIATALSNRTGAIWDSVTGRRIATLEGHTDELKSICYSPDGRRIVTASLDGTLRFWDSGTGKLLFFREHKVGSGKTGVSFACFSPDGKRLAVGDTSGFVDILDTSTNNLKWRTNAHSGIISGIIFSHDGRRFATSSHDKSVKIWDGSLRYPSLNLFHYGEVTSVCFSSDSRRLITSSSDGTARIWGREPDVQIDTALANSPREQLFIARCSFYRGLYEASARAFGHCARLAGTITDADRVLLRGIPACDPSTLADHAEIRSEPARSAWEGWQLACSGKREAALKALARFRDWRPGEGARENWRGTLLGLLYEREARLLLQAQ